MHTVESRISLSSEHQTSPYSSSSRLTREILFRFRFGAQNSHTGFAQTRSAPRKRIFLFQIRVRKEVERSRLRVRDISVSENKDIGTNMHASIRVFFAKIRFNEEERNSSRGEISWKRSLLERDSIQYSNVTRHRTIVPLSTAINGTAF